MKKRLSKFSLIITALFSYLISQSSTAIRFIYSNPFVTILCAIAELGLVMFLIGAGVPGGVNFIDKFKWSYFIYGAVMTTVPMIAGYLIARYVFKLSILNNLGSITGGMTSTPALGTLIATAGTDEVSAAYAATYPFALVAVVLAAKIIILVC